MAFLNPDAFLVTKPNGRDSGFTEDLGLRPEQL
jgi:hypothetical protein